MLEKYNKYQLLKVFFNNPTEKFRLRELGRIAKISPPSVINYLKELEKEKLIEKRIIRGVPYYNAILDKEGFRELKKVSIIYEIYNSGLAEYLWNKLSPEAIILYGSHAKGESTEYSDLDIFIIGKERKIDISEFENKLNKQIHLMFDSNVKNIPNELKNNLVNGIILKGYLKLF